MNNILKYIFLAGIVLLVVYSFLRNRYPDSDGILESVKGGPVQAETAADEFLVDKGDSTYTITPLYEYELNGLVVSYHESTHWMDYYHRKWGDFLNVKDLCVLWGNDVSNNLYDEFRFKSGDWDCSYYTKNREAFQTFDPAAFSNNHLLADDKKIKKAIMSVQRGDQVYLHGYLVNYANDKGYKRDTSTTRKDRGNHSCEIIFVTDFKVLKRSAPFWDVLNIIAKYIVAIAAIVIVVIFFSQDPYKRKKSAL